jgi:hypothetical protein
MLERLCGQAKRLSQDVKEVDEALNASSQRRENMWRKGRRRYSACTEARRWAHRLPIEGAYMETRQPSAEDQAYARRITQVDRPTPDAALFIGRSVEYSSPYTGIV